MDRASLIFCAGALTLSLAVAAIAYPHAAHKMPMETKIKVE
jgi:hypothetical protein